MENPFFDGSDEDGDDDSEMDGTGGGSKGLVIKREEKDLASNQDEAAKDVEEEKEPNTEDKSLSAEERKGDEINLGKEGGLTLGLT